MQSERGKSDYKVKGLEALSCYARAMQLNPYFPFAPLRYGMCLDWLDRQKEGTAYYERALALYPKSAMLPAYQGWHYTQMEDYATAKQYLERSLSLRWSGLAYEWLKTVNAILAQTPTTASAKVPPPTPAQ